MKWTEISLRLPREITALYTQISSIQKNSCIAGGFLSDLYMKKPYQDVDFFIKSNEKKEKEIHRCMKQLGYHLVRNEGEDNSYDFAFSVHTYQKKKWTIQLIFTPLGIRHVKYFDFRFREFFYFKDSCYATPEALKDIKEKKLRFGVSVFPLKTFYRFLSFTDRYGFTHDRANKDLFNHLFNHQYYREERFNQFLTKIPDSFLKQTFMDLFKDQDLLTLPTLTDKEELTSGVMEKITSFPLPRDLYEKAITPKRFQLLHSFPYPREHIHILTKQRTKKIHVLQTELFKQRVRFVSIGKGEFYHKIEQTLTDQDSPTFKDNILDIFQEACKIEQSFINAFYYDLNQLKGFETAFSEIKKHINNRSAVKVFDQFSFLKIYSVSDLLHYARGNLVIYDFESLGSFAYNIKTKKIQHATSWSILHNIMEEFLSSYHEQNHV